MAGIADTLAGVLFAALLAAVGWFTRRAFVDLWTQGDRLEAKVDQLAARVDDLPSTTGRYDSIVEELHRWRDQHLTEAHPPEQPGPPALESSY